jgi:hypothetical protein
MTTFIDVFGEFVTKVWDLRGMKLRLLIMLTFIDLMILLFNVCIQTDELTVGC